MAKIRKKIRIYKSLRAVHAQLLDNNRVLAGKLYKFKSGQAPIKQSFDFGEDFGRLAIKFGVKKVSFDRNRFIYHGRVKSFAEGLRKVGLEF